MERIPIAGPSISQREIDYATDAAATGWYDGAAAKGSTLLNFCGLTAADLEFVAERSQHKQGKLMPGAHIPIIPSEELANRAPEVTLLLAWNFADEILVQQSAYRESGGRFLIPIPEVRLV